MAGKAVEFSEAGRTAGRTTEMTKARVDVAWRRRSGDKEVLREALIGFRGGGHHLRDQAGDKGAEQSLAPAAGVVHELEEAEIAGQLLLRDAAVRAEPGP